MNILLQRKKDVEAHFGDRQQVAVNLVGLVKVTGHRDKEYEHNQRFLPGTIMGYAMIALMATGIWRCSRPCSCSTFTAFTVLLSNARPSPRRGSCRTY
jgi:hypothetical protein